MKSIKFLLIIALLIKLVGCTQTQGIDEERQWPSYRGYYGSGILDNTSLPENWDVDEGVNIRWKVDIPGLALSCPVVWEEKLFITSAISEIDNKELRAGAYVNSYPVEDESVHKWKVYCYNGKTGELIWERTSYSGVPEVKRHPKSTHANCTPATDGKHVVVFFASEGLYCYDVNGELLWEKDFG